MRRPRWTIGRVMMIPAMMAIDCALVRLAVERDRAWIPDESTIRRMLSYRFLTECLRGNGPFINTAYAMMILPMTNLVILHHGSRSLDPGRWAFRAVIWVGVATLAWASVLEPRFLFLEPDCGWAPFRPLFPGLRSRSSIHTLLAFGVYCPLIGALLILPPALLAGRLASRFRIVRRRPEAVAP